MRKRQLAVNNLLDKGQIQFHPDTCKGIKKDLEGGRTGSRRSREGEG
jgi:hypothetical protein